MQGYQNQISNYTQPFTNGKPKVMFHYMNSKEKQQLRGEFNQQQKQQDVYINLKEQEIKQPLINQQQHENKYFQQNHNFCYKEIGIRNSIIIQLSSKLEKFVKVNSDLASQVQRLKNEHQVKKLVILQDNFKQNKQRYYINQNSKLQSQNEKLKLKISQLSQDLKQTQTNCNNLMQQKKNFIKQKYQLSQDLKKKELELQNFKKQFDKLTSNQNQENQIKNRKQISTHDLQAETKIIQLQQLIKVIKIDYQQLQSKCSQLALMIEKIQKIVLKEITFKKQQLLAGKSLTNSGRIDLNSPISHPQQTLLSLFEDVAKLNQYNQQKIKKLQQQKSQFHKNNEKFRQENQQQIINQYKMKQLEITKALKSTDQKFRQATKQKLRLRKRIEELQEQLKKVQTRILQASVYSNMNQHNREQQQQIYQHLQREYQKDIQRQKQKAKQKEEQFNSINKLLQQQNNRLQLQVQKMRKEVDLKEQQRQKISQQLRQLRKQNQQKQDHEI